MYELMAIFAVISWLLTVVSLFLLRRVAPCLSMLDYPQGRKQHEQATPVVGGLALTIGLLPLTYLFPVHTASLLSWGVPVLLLVLLGLRDDLREVSSSHRLVLHLLSGLSLVPLGLEIGHLGDLFGQGPVLLGLFALPVTIFAVAAAINSYNMIDGIDGLLALMALVPLTVLAWLAAKAGLTWEAILAVSLASGVAAFALFNVRFPWVTRASVFMGDAGSTLLGFSIAWLCVAVAMRGAMPPVLALYLIMLPLMDTAAVIYRRRYRSVSAAMAGRDHLHHILLDCGLGIGATALLMTVFSLVLAGSGLLMWHMRVPESMMFCVFVVLVLGYGGLTRCPERLKYWFDRRQLPNV